MAGNSRMDKSKRIREMLKEFQCPYLEGLEDSVIHELLLTPGEARTRLLVWLLEKFDPKVQQVLTTHKNDIGTIAKLTQILSIMGLCSPHDYELVKGSTSLSKQIIFLDSLVEIIHYNISCGGSTDVLRLNQEKDQCCIFLDNLCLREYLSSVFLSPISLVPPDIAHVCGIDASLDNTKGSSFGQLQKEVLELKQTIIERQHQFEELVESHTYLPVDATTLDSCCRSLQVSLSTLVQLIDDFYQSYKNEIEPWTKRDVPVLSTVGPCTKRINSHLLLVNELLENASKLQIQCTKWNEIRHIFICKDEIHECSHKHFQEYLDLQKSN